MSNPILGILYKTLTACLKRTKVGYLRHNIKLLPYTNKTGKPRSYSQHSVLVEFINILAAMLPCTCYSEKQYKKNLHIMFKCFTSSRTSILQLSIIATFLSIRSKIRPGVAIITWTETEIWAKLLYICVHEPRSVPYENSASSQTTQQLQRSNRMSMSTTLWMRRQISHVHLWIQKAAIACLRFNTACSMRQWPTDKLWGTQVFH
jgi:hypothetical protein